MVRGQRGGLNNPRARELLVRFSHDTTRVPKDARIAEIVATAEPRSVRDGCPRSERRDLKTRATRVRRGRHKGTREGQGKEMQRFQVRRERRSAAGARVTRRSACSNQRAGAVRPLLRACCARCAWVASKSKQATHGPSMYAHVINVTWKRLSMDMATLPKRTGSFWPKKRQAKMAAM